MTIPVERLINAFGDCLGRERARAIVCDVCLRMDHDRQTCSEPEAIEIVRHVANRADGTPFVRTAAQTVQTRIQVGHL